MPELPEVEVLVRHLRPLLRGQTIRAVTVRRTRVIAPDSPARLRRALVGATFTDLTRRGKYLVFTLRPPHGNPIGWGEAAAAPAREDAHPAGSARMNRAPRSQPPLQLIGHLGMTGRMYLARRDTPLPKHAAVVLELGTKRFIYEDPRYFGRLTLDTSAVARLGPEPLVAGFTPEVFGRALARSRRAIKIRLLDQELVAGVGNIYASEALFRAKLSPRLPARRLTRLQVGALHRAIRAVLTEAIRFGSTLPLHQGERRNGDGLFYFGRAEGALDYYEERLRVYDRKGQPCIRCRAPIRRILQAARSTFFCPKCQQTAKVRRKSV
jgi:formamidopyrimidine-DNA glycosylase